MSKSFKGVVFKQWYVTRNDSAVRVKNRKHLIYIATKKECENNKGCGFSLFGRLPYKRRGDINNMEEAKKVIGQVSNRRTIYRAVISLDHQTARDKGLYDRKNWEALVYDQVKSIQKEMHIESLDFCWLASVHRKHGHPHVHIMYWDNSSKVREEHIPSERFEIMAERVRAAFNRGLFAEELSEMRAQEKAIRDELKLQMRAALREANPADPLHTDQVSERLAAELGRDLRELVSTLPRTGRLVYKLVPEGYKAKLDALTDRILQIPDFKRLHKQLAKLVDDKSALYGNAEERRAYNREQASAQLHKELGNQTLAFLKEWRQELHDAEMPPVQHAVRHELEADPKLAKQVQLLVDAMPTERTPLYVLLEDPEMKQQYRSLYEGLLQHPAVKDAVNTEIRRAWKAHQNGEAPVHKVQGLSDSDAKAFRKKYYCTCCGSVRHELETHLQEQASYLKQEEMAAAMNLLWQLFGTASQRRSQQAAAKALDYNHEWRGMKERSKTEQKNLMRRKQQGAWEQE